MDALDNAASFDRDHLREQLLGALRGAAAQVAFAALGAHDDARPGDTEAFRGRLMSLEFVFSNSLLARHGCNSFSHKTPGTKATASEACSPMPAGDFLDGYEFSLLLLRLGRSQDHDHTATFHHGGLFDGRKICQLFCYFLQVIQRQINVVNLTTSKTDAYSHFVAIFQPTPGITDLETLVIDIGFWPEADLFDFDLGLRPACVAFFLGLFVEEFPEVHHPAYGWLGIGGYLHQVQVGFIGQAHRLLDGDHAHVTAIGADQTDFFDSNSLVDSILGRADKLLLSRQMVNTARCRSLASSVPDDTMSLS